MKDEKVKLTDILTKKIEDEKSEELKSIKDELNKKSEEVKSFNKLKVDLERSKRENEELQSKLEAEYEGKLSKVLSEEKSKIREEENNKAMLKAKEFEGTINQLKEELKKTQEKAERASGRDKGEAQELVIEDKLKELFPMDIISEVVKGKRGADVVHLIRDESMQVCGKIIYESKRVSAFSSTWIDKLKEDQLRDKADIAVLITENLPKNMNKKIDLIDKVWVCSFSSFEELSIVLRENLIRISLVLGSQTNRGDKMNMLYDYLTSNEFKMRLDVIVEGFTEMKGSIERERTVMEKQWSERSKQIEKILLNTANFYGAIKGIAGSAIPDVKMLEMPN